MPIEIGTVVDSLKRLLPFEDDGHAQRVLEATLRALAGFLDDQELETLGAELGPDWADALTVQGRIAPASLETMYQRVGLYAGVRLSQARELAQLSCRALAEHLPEAAVQRLRAELPELAALFEPKAPEQPAAGPHVLRADAGDDHTLAGGRPGSTRPLSDAAPLAGHGPREPLARPAHTHSVARSADPHGDTKLSSTRGLTQEREHRSLATARPHRDEPEG